MKFDHKIDTELYHKFELKNIINTFDDWMDYSVEDTIGTLIENQEHVRYDIDMKLQQYEF
jgi:hypothetical protein